MLNCVEYNFFSSLHRLRLYTVWIVAGVTGRVFTSITRSLGAAPCCLAIRNPLGSRGFQFEWTALTDQMNKPFRRRRHCSCRCCCCCCCHVHLRCPNLTHTFFTYTKKKLSNLFKACHLSASGRARKETGRVVYFNILLRRFIFIILWTEMKGFKRNKKHVICSIFFLRIMEISWFSSLI